jgi:ABC-type nitrate/sulfonate/bicarbonate transport system substrate-binding protein
MKLPTQFAFITLLAAAAAWVCLGGGGQRREPVLRVGINPAPGYELIFLAEEKGFFRDEGLAVRLVEFMCLADCRRAFERGQVDVIGSSAVTVPVGREGGRYSPKIADVSDAVCGSDGRAGAGDGRAVEVAKFLRALSRAAAYAEENQTDACHIMARHSLPQPDDAAEAAARGAGVPIQSARGDWPVTFREPANDSWPGEVRADAADRPASINLALWQTRTQP